MALSTSWGPPQKLGRLFRKLFGEGRYAVVGCPGQDISGAGHNPVGESKRTPYSGYPVGGFEADAHYILGQAIGVFLYY